MLIILRRLFTIMLASIAALHIESCVIKPDVAHLVSRPHKPTQVVQPGERKLGLSTLRDGLLYVPSKYWPEKAMPLVVMLHGAGGDAERMSTLFSFAEEAGVIMLVPDSRDITWDVVLSTYGEDDAFIDKASEYTFDRCLIDSRRIALAGFSDGASYALSLGICNTDLFTHIIAFSPGILAAPRQYGNTRIFISHGTQDKVLPFSTTHDKIVPTLEEWGYNVHFRKFDGPHRTPKEIAIEGLKWFIE